MRKKKIQRRLQGEIVQEERWKEGGLRGLDTDLLA